MTDDELLDEALGRYSDCQPRPGLEARVLRRVQQPQVGWWIAGSTLAGGAIAAALALVTVLIPERQPAPVVAIVETRKLVEEKLVERPGPVRAAAMGRVHRVRFVKGKPFQIGRPVTREERALLAFVESAPAEVLRSFAAEQGAPVRPIQIGEIVIEALPEGENK